MYWACGEKDGNAASKLKKKEKLGGKGKLTNVLIAKLTKYYGLAILWRNIDSIINMKKAIINLLNHLCSTNEKPRHDDCPVGADSWCKWRVTEGAGKLKDFNHPPPLHPDVEKHLIPIYDDLSREDLLTRCLGGHTQNANESYNSTIWRLAPKHLNSGIKIVEIAAFTAAGRSGARVRVAQCENCPRAPYYFVFIKFLTILI